MNACSRFPLPLAAMVLGLSAVAIAAWAQRTEPMPEAIDNLKVTEYLDTPLPLDLEFQDETGRTVRLRDYFDGRRPVILTLNYYRCPMLCGLQLNGLLEALQKLSWTVGNQFEIVTVSFDPRETPTLAKLKKQNMLMEYGRPGAANGWHFLTGREKNIAQLTDACGFEFRYDEERGEYAHAAVLFVVTPDGRLSRYLYGVLFDPTTLRLSLVEAAEGKIGSTFDHFLLYCYHYDADARRYAPVAMNIMRLGAGLCLVMLGTVLGSLWLHERRRKSRTGEGATS